MSNFTMFKEAIENNRAAILVEGKDGSIQMLGSFNSILDEEYTRLEDTVGESQQTLTVTGAYVGV